MMLPTKDEKSCLLFSTKILSSNEKKMDHCAGVFGSGYTGKLAFTDLSAKPDNYSFESNKNLKLWSGLEPDSLILDGWLKIQKYESDIYHYFCNCPSVSPVTYIYADSLTHVASAPHECDMTYEYFDEIEEPDCNFPSHLGDEKIQFVCAMDFETTETKETSTTIATTESYETSVEKIKRLKAELMELAKKHETVTEDNIIKTKEGTSDPYS